MKNNKLYHKKYIMCLCIKGKNPIYLNSYSSIYYNNKYNETETVLEIINYDDIFNTETKKILKGLDLGSYILSFTMSKEDFFVDSKKIKREEFIYLSLIVKCEEKFFDDITFYKILKTLPIEEYIKFCNDYEVKNITHFIANIK